MYKRRILPALQCLDPEFAHDIACNVLQLASKLDKANPFRQEFSVKPYTCMGLEFPNRVGLAAGMDKNGDYINGFQALGFGFLELGSVTFGAQPGNPKPRVWAAPWRGEIRNRMGMPNKGVAHCAYQKFKAVPRIPVGISIAPTTGVRDPAADLAYSYVIAKLTADYIVLNLSCPNVVGDVDTKGILNALREERQANSSMPLRPTLVKMPRWLDTSGGTEAFLWRVRANGFDGVVCANSPAASQGSLSGTSLLDGTLVHIRTARRVLGPDATIIASGGIMSPLQAVFAINAGANLVQIYSGLVYEGASIVPQIAKAVQDL